MHFPIQNTALPMGNVLTRGTHFAHHSFYSKLLLKANIFPALGFSLLLKHEKYLSVMSQGQTLWVCQICSTRVKWNFPHQTGKNFSCHCKAFPKYHHKMGKRCFRGRERPAQPWKYPSFTSDTLGNISPGSSLQFPSPLPISPALTTHLPPNFHTRLVSAFDESNSGLGHFVLH